MYAWAAPALRCGGNPVIRGQPYGATIIPCASLLPIHPTDGGQKNLYANCFAIYGLSKYAAVFGAAPAADMALQTFRAWDALVHDPATGEHRGRTRVELCPARLHLSCIGAWSRPGDEQGAQTVSHSRACVRWAHQQRDAGPRLFGSPC